MKQAFIDSEVENNKLSLNLLGEFDLYQISNYQEQIEKIDLSNIESVSINLTKITSFDTAASIFLNDFINKLKTKNIDTQIVCEKQDVLDTIELVQSERKGSKEFPHPKKENPLEELGKKVFQNYRGLLSFMAFLGKLFIMQLYFLSSQLN